VTAAAAESAGGRRSTAASRQAGGESGTGFGGDDGVVWRAMGKVRSGLVRWCATCAFLVEQRKEVVGWAVIG